MSENTNTNPYAPPPGLCSEGEMPEPAVGQVWRFNGKVFSEEFTIVRRRDENDGWIASTDGWYSDRFDSRFTFVRGPSLPPSASQDEGRRVDKFTAVDVGQTFEVVKAYPDEWYHVAVGDRVTLCGATSNEDGSYRFVKDDGNCERVAWFWAADVRRLAPTPLKETPVGVREHVHEWVSKPNWKCTFKDCGERASVGCFGCDEWTRHGGRLTARCEAHREDKAPAAQPLEQVRREPRRVKTYEELYAEACASDGVPVPARCNECKGPGPINELGRCFECSAKRDSFTFYKMTLNGYATPKPAPEAWRPSVDPEFWIPGINEHGGT